MRAMIERVPADKGLASHLGRYWQLQKQGWEATALLAPDKRTVLLMAHLDGAETPQAGQFSLLSGEAA